MKRAIFGQGRCGSSLAMQMLAATGVPVTGRYPAYECERLQRSIAEGDREWAWLGELPSGSVVKALDCDLAGPTHKAFDAGVFLVRDFKQQARSKAKFMRILGGLDARPAEWEGVLRQCHGKVLRAAEFSCRGPLKVLRFELIVRCPRVGARKLAEALDVDGADLDAMAAVVRQRSPRCYPGLLEKELMEEDKRAPGS